MTLFRNVFFVAALAGLFAGLVLAAVQSFTTVPLILKAETFEPAEEAGSAGHEAMAASDASEQDAGAGASNHENSEAWAPADGFERFAYTVLANVLGGIGFALLLVAASEFAGGIQSWRQGIFWGLAGFTVFILAPDLGLPPNMPGMPAADLLPRQSWWIATALATAAGLALVVFRKGAVASVVGVALILLPHLIGAPQPVDPTTAVPEALHREFITAATLASLVFWVVLGAAVGVVRPYFLAEGDIARSPRIA